MFFVYSSRFKACSTEGNCVFDLAEFEQSKICFKFLQNLKKKVRSGASRFLIVFHEKLLKRPLNISGLLFIPQTFFDKCVQMWGREAQLDFLLALLQNIHLKSRSSCMLDLVILWAWWKCELSPYFNAASLGDEWSTFHANGSVGKGGCKSTMRLQWKFENGLKMFISGEAHLLQSITINDRFKLI